MKSNVISFRADRETVFRIRVLQMGDAIRAGKITLYEAFKLAEDDKLW